MPSLNPTHPLLWALLPLVACGTAAMAQPEADQATVLENDHVRMTFEAHHAGLASLMDKTSGVEHVHAVQGAHALWQIQCSHAKDSYELASTQFPCAAATVTTGPASRCATFTWRGLALGAEAASVDVVVEVELPQESGIAAWRIHVSNASSGWGLRAVEFPKVTGMLEAGNYDLAGAFGHTETWGALYRGFSGRLEKRYPDGWHGMSTQFICATRQSSSIYFAAHDPRAWFKEFVVEPGNECFIRTYAENIGVAGSGYQAPYPAMLGVYQGDWLSGCKIYRKFAAAAPWTAKGKLAAGEVTLPAGRAIGLWLREWTWTKDSVGDYPSMLKQVKDAQDYFGVPLGFHWYNWQVADFDTHYPHFFPPKAGVAKLARGMVDLGLVVMPYINGRIADQNNPDFAGLVKDAAKAADGNIYTELYDNEVKQAVMCPSTRFWQDTVTANVRQLVTGLGVNAVYIDQIAAAPPCLCFDPTHGHPLGGGSWWVDAYRQMLGQVRGFARGDGRSVLITSENTAEPYIDGLDANLVVTEHSKCSIPILPAVYSGYTMYFGSAEAALGLSNEQWPIELGRDFLWGCQNGWFGFNLFNTENTQKKAYLRTLAQARVAGIKYLAEGELLGLIDDGSRSDYQDVPWLQGSIWKGEDGTLGIVIANYRTTPATLAMSFNPLHYALASPAGYRRIQLHPAGSEPVALPPGNIALNETLAPLEVRILAIAPPQPH